MVDGETAAKAATVDERAAVVDDEAAVVDDGADVVADRAAAVDDEAAAKAAMVDEKAAVVDDGTAAVAKLMWLTKLLQLTPWLTMVLLWSMMVDDEAAVADDGVAMVDNKAALKAATVDVSRKSCCSLEATVVDEAAAVDAVIGRDST